MPRLVELSGLLVLGACGRIGFDAQTDITGDGARDGAGDGSTIDAAGATMILNPTADTFIVQNSGANNNNSMQLTTGTTASGNPGMALLRFDLSAIPADTVILEATLQLTQVSSMGTTTITVDVERVTAAWDSTTVIFSSRPTWDTVKSSTNVMLNVQVPYYWDVSTFVRQWVDGTQVNHGLVVEAPAAPAGELVQFGSRENSVMADGPQLTIVTP